MIDATGFDVTILKPYPWQSLTAIVAVRVPGIREWRPETLLALSPNSFRVRALAVWYEREENHG